MHLTPFRKKAVSQGSNGSTFCLHHLLNIDRWYIFEPEIHVHHTKNVPIVKVAYTMMKKIVHYQLIDYRCKTFSIQFIVAPIFSFPFSLSTNSSPPFFRYLFFMYDNIKHNILDERERKNQMGCQKRDSKPNDMKTTGAQKQNKRKSTHEYGHFRWVMRIQTISRPAKIVRN